jgi:hypothetical protein
MRRKGMKSLLIFLLFMAVCTAYARHREGALLPRGAIVTPQMVTAQSGWRDMMVPEGAIMEDGMVYVATAAKGFWGDTWTVRAAPAEPTGFRQDGMAQLGNLALAGSGIVHTSDKPLADGMQVLVVGDE